MGPGAPTLANSPICQFTNLPTLANLLITNLQILQQSFTNLAKSIAILPRRARKPRRGIKFLHKLLAILQQLSAKFAKLQLLLQL